MVYIFSIPKYKMDKAKQLKYVHIFISSYFPYCFIQIHNHFAMADVPVYNSSTLIDTKNQFSNKVELTQMLQGGAVLEVTNVEQAKIAEEAGACSVVIHHGTSRMPDPSLVKDIKRAVSIPVMARVRIGHFVEAQILEAIGVDYIDECELLDTADDDNYINKHKFRVPFACGCQNLEEALMRVMEGAVIIWMQGHISMWRTSRSGYIVETMRTMRSVMGMIRSVTNADEDEVLAVAKKMGVPYDIVAQVKQMGRLPVVQFAAGGIVTPADAALMMQLGCDGVFVGSEIFNCLDPSKQIRAIVQAVRHYNDPCVLAESSCGLNDDVEEDIDDVIGFLM